MKNLWQDWQLFKKTEFTNPTLQLKKQGIMSKTDQYAEFTYRPNLTSPPSMQEFYESIINGIIKRFQLGLYQGEYQYYLELQQCLHEFIRLMNFKSEILVEVFQSITNLNLSKEAFPSIVVPCASCGMFIYVTFHCEKCFSAFYCDKTCQKNYKQKHDLECSQFIKVTPQILYALQVELHCGGSLGEDVKIYFQHEKKLTLQMRGQRFMNFMYKILLKNRWLKNNGYNISEGDSKITLQSTKKPEQGTSDIEPVLEDALCPGSEGHFLKLRSYLARYPEGDLQYAYQFCSHILFSNMKINQNLQDAIATLNGFTQPRAEVVMNRIFAKPGSSYKDLFTPEEIIKFQKINITEQSLSNCVNAMNFILMHIVAERNLSEVEETLSKNQLQPQKLEIFRNAWLQYGNDYSIKIREKPIAVQQVLHSFNWNISLQIDESRLPMKNVANFMNVEGKIDSADDLYSHDARNPAINYIFETQASGTSDQKIEKFSIKFQKAQLLEIFEQFENIQESLDKLM